MKIININSIDEMKRLGICIGNRLSGGETICLHGDLGAGKTFLTQSIGKGMGISDFITSPTFALLNIYNGEINLNHFDTYRLESGAEFCDLGFEDYLFSDDVNIIEWPEVINDYLPEDPLHIFIEKGQGELRTLRFETEFKQKYKRVLECLEI